MTFQAKRRTNTILSILLSILSLIYIYPIS